MREKSASVAISRRRTGITCRYTQFLADEITANMSIPAAIPCLRSIFIHLKNRADIEQILDQTVETAVHRPTGLILANGNSTLFYIYFLIDFNIIYNDSAKALVQVKSSGPMGN